VVVLSDTELDDCDSSDVELPLVCWPRVRVRVCCRGVVDCVSVLSEVALLASDDPGTAELAPF